MTNQPMQPTDDAALITPPTAEPDAPQPASSSVPPSPPRYRPGHPWYYLPDGDHQPPLPAHEIPPAANVGTFVARELPRRSDNREYRLHELLAAEEAELTRCIARYAEVVERGADALSRYDREIAYDGDLELARASSLALVHNHIAWHKGRIEWIKAELDRYGPLLF